jgi:hypothetical protein
MRVVASKWLSCLRNDGTSLDSDELACDCPCAREPKDFSQMTQARDLGSDFRALCLEDLEGLLQFNC